MLFPTILLQLVCSQSIKGEKNNHKHKLYYTVFINVCDALFFHFNPILLSHCVKVTINFVAGHRDNLYLSYIEWNDHTNSSEDPIS